MSPPLRATTAAASCTDIWAVTAYFNPAHFKRRVQNYHVFRRQLAVPLVAVELSFDGTFDLQSGDADVLIQLRGRDVMWHKERLLNIGFRHVPASCRKVAWVDCDVVFESDDWMVRASSALDRCAVVHLFDERHDLAPDARMDSRPTPHAEATAWSSVYKVVTGRAVAGEFRGMGAVAALRSTTGLAWAGRRELLDRYGLYDACIAGSGDKANACGALGRLDDAVAAHRMNSRRADHYRAWAASFSDAVQRSVGYVPGRVFHLWHGDLKNRRYAERPSWLEHFDPFTDIALDSNDCWRWSSDKPELHTQLSRYFESRLEDGHAAV